MKKKVVFLIALCSLASCNNGSAPIRADKEEATGSYEMPYRGGTVEASFKTSDYDVPSTTYSKEIALDAFCFAMVANTQKGLDAYYHDLGFENPYYPQRYIDGKHEIQSCHYGFAARKMNGFYLITAALDGMQYQLEWYDNFYLGKEGLQESYRIVAESVYEDLGAYLKQYAGYKTKVLISGYSRLGAVAEILGVYLNQDVAQYQMTVDDVYVYSFEASLSTPDPVEYQNIHHVYNREDPVPYIPPKEYGFSFFGVSHDIYSDHLVEYVKEEFDTEIKDYIPSSEYPTRASVVQKALSILLEAHTDDPSAFDVSTREKYAELLQEHLARPISHFAAAGMDSLADALTKRMDGINPLSLLGSEEKIVAFIAGLAKDVGITDYTEEEIAEDVKALLPLLNTIIKYHLVDLMPLVNHVQRNIEALFYTHMPFVNYSLLLHS